MTGIALIPPDAPAEVVALGNAKRLTAHIRLMAKTVTDNVTKLLELVAEAKATNAHEALGYPSWTAYLIDAVGPEPMRLALEARRELVGELSSQGMSTRAIAPIVGVSIGTVHADRQVFSSEQVASDDVGSVRKVVDREVGEASITGLDGKQYAREVEQTETWAKITKLAAEGHTAREIAYQVGMTTDSITTAHLQGRIHIEKAVKHRRALPEVGKSVAYDARKLTARINGLWSDDRLDRNRDALKPMCRDLLDLHDACFALWNVLEDDDSVEEFKNSFPPVDEPDQPGDVGF